MLLLFLFLVLFFLILDVFDCRLNVLIGVRFDLKELEKVV